MLLINLRILHGSVRCNEKTYSIGSDTGATAERIRFSSAIKIGFLVKMPEEAWFQDEWKYAEMAGKDYGFEVIKMVPPTVPVLSAIDNLGAQGAQGFIICTPDVTLGPAIWPGPKLTALR